jgi:hypothetical protein
VDLGCLILVPYSQIIQSTVSRWNREGHPLSVTKAINVMRSGVEVKEEKWWSKASQLFDRGSAFQVIPMQALLPPGPTADQLNCDKFST